MEAITIVIDYNVVIIMSLCFLISPIILMGMIYFMFNRSNITSSLVGNLTDEKKKQAFDFLKEATSMILDDKVLEVDDVRKALSLKRLKNKENTTKEIVKNEQDEEGEES